MTFGPLANAVLENNDIDPDELATAPRDETRVVPSGFSEKAEEYRAEAIAHLRAVRDFTNLQIDALRLYPNDPEFQDQMFRAGGISTEAFNRAFRRWRCTAAFEAGGPDCGTA